MTDPTPPAAEPMPDQSRARIRAELLQAAQGPSPARRWVIPGAVAAAVVLVVGLAAWAVRAGDGTGPDDGSAPVAGSSTAAASTPVETPPATSSEPPDQAGGRQVGTSDCKGELTYVLPGAERAASFGDGSSFWVKDGRFVLCDARAGTTTVHHPLPLDPAEDVATYAVSSIYPPGPHSSAVVRVAGGIVPAGAMAYDVSYTFPNGDTQHAETTTDEQGRTWWRMVYAYEDGGGNEMDKPPIEVTVSYSGVQKHYTLRWGLDTCAQANHGC